ncbi:ATP-binding cassette sub-family A member like [Heracleum sosnowskyi]|uniref:ATP-binding cassette sub-family A member like n=1 Tax=Heracleum sosnowskyi TaxID=360622 RepID=A0AAD8MGU2_9APIA|nr:ATP-binding cassette sub-family A member like [Heracleum sosnowskyi]
MKSMEEIQFLGFFGIFKAALSLTTSYRKVFCLLTLSIAIRLLLVFLFVQTEKISRSSLGQYKYAPNHTQMGSQIYFDTNQLYYDIDTYQIYFHTQSEILPFFLVGEWISFWLYKIAYFMLYQAFSQIHTSAVVYATACSYTAKEITYKKVAEVVTARLWKRLMVNYIWNFVIVLALHIIAIYLVTLCAFILGRSPIGIMVIIILLLIYFSSFVYINILWQLANVVSVLENVYGFQAMLKSKKLIKGNTGVSAAIFVTINLCFLGMQLGFEASIGDIYSAWKNISSACLWFMLLSMLMLFGFAIQTVIYFICKSFHHENIDKSLLADHLHELSGGDYIQSFKSKIAQFVFFFSIVLYLILVFFKY